MWFLSISFHSSSRGVQDLSSRFEKGKRVKQGVTKGHERSVSCQRCLQELGRRIVLL